MKQVNDAPNRQSPPRSPVSAQEGVEQPSIEYTKLLGRIRYLTDSCADLKKRVERVEASVVFRFLRRLGAIIVRLRLPLPEGIAGQFPNYARDDHRYAEWAEEADLLQRLTVQRQGPLKVLPERVEVILNAHDAEAQKLALTLASLTAQDHCNWDLTVCADSSTQPWLSECVERHTIGHKIRWIHSGDIREALRRAFSTVESQFGFILHPHAVLHPSALRQFLGAADGCAAVYSDWDHTDGTGHRHSPRFTPDFSPELLSHTLYWGWCFLLRIDAARGVPLITAKMDPIQELTLGLVGVSDAVRVPKVLWHLQDAPVEPTLHSGPPRVSGAKATIIICSREATRLDRCLRSLASGIKGHEIVTVLHTRTDRAERLKEVASRHGALAIGYEGPFHFGEMNRMGVEASSGDVICLLNDDVFPITAGWLDLILAQATRTEVGAVGALLLYRNGTIQHAGIGVGLWSQPAHVGRGMRQSSLWPWLRLTREVTAVTGACLTLRRGVWDELGGFDPEFPVNYNDVDLCLRVAERGYRVILEARSVLIHEEAQTRIARVRLEESERFYQKWQHVLAAPDRFYNPQLLHSSEAIGLPEPWTASR